MGCVLYLRVCFGRISSLFGLLFSIACVALAAVATTLDGMTAEFNFEARESIPCYCEETEASFNATFQQVGAIDCSNAFTRDVNYLIANTALSIACLVICVLLLLSLLFGALNMICLAVCCDRDTREDNTYV